MRHARDAQKVTAVTLDSLSPWGEGYMYPMGYKSVALELTNA